MEGAILILSLHIYISFYFLHEGYINFDFLKIVQMLRTCAWGVIILISTFGIFNGNISKPLAKTWSKPHSEGVGVPSGYPGHSGPLMCNSQRPDNELLPEPRR